MRIHEIITEAQVGPATVGPGGINVPTSASVPDARNNLPPTRDELGRPLPDPLEASPIDPIDFIPGGRVMRAGRIASAAEKSSIGAASRLGTKAAEIGQDIKNLPSPYKPWTWDKLGRVDANSMAHQAYKEKFGKSFDPMNWTGEEGRAFTKLEKNYVDRGYSEPVRLQGDIGHLTRQPGYKEFYNKNPHPPGSDEFKDWNRKAYDFEQEHGRPARQKSGLDHANQAVKDVAARALVSTGTDLAGRAINNNQNTQSRPETWTAGTTERQRRSN